MQDTITLKVEPREITGKAVKRLRREGRVPAVIHDHGKDSIIIQGDYLDIVRTYRQAGKHQPIRLITDKRQYTALIKKVTFEPRKNQLNHIVFNAVKANQKVKAEVPIRPRYDGDNESSPAERASLIVLNHLDVIEVEGLPDKLPSFVEYDAEKLVEVGDSVYVTDLIIPKDVEIEIKPDPVPVASVYEPSALAAANEAAGGTAEEAAPEPEEPAEGGEEAEASSAEEEAEAKE